MLPFRE